MALRPSSLVPAYEWGTRSPWKQVADALQSSERHSGQGVSYAWIHLEILGMITKAVLAHMHAPPRPLIARGISQYR